MANFVPIVGSARRSQGVVTYGIGAIVDFATGSFMPLGLDQMITRWAALDGEARSRMRINEARLARLLRVEHFLGLPIADEKALADFDKKVARPYSVPCIRFPDWLECPRCQRLGTAGDPFEAQTDGKLSCVGCKVTVNPVRFVTACRRHHVEDFPWLEWAHRKGQMCQRPNLFLKSRGKSTALGDLEVTCTCGESEGLGEIFTPHALGRWPCSGRQPWLLRTQSCSQERVVLQRGASNVHFAITASMLSIPPTSEAVARKLDSLWDAIESVYKGVPRNVAKVALSSLFEKAGVDADVAMDWVRRRAGIATDPEGEDEASCRRKEFAALCTATVPDPAGDHGDFQNAPFALTGSSARWFDLASAVFRLREVRAYCGFTRIQDVPVTIEGIPESIQAGRIAPLATGRRDWAPAIEVRGEGIFLRFNEPALLQWLETHPGAEQRAKRINKIFSAACADSRYQPPYEITARRLMVHAFSHALLRRLSLDCGYSSSSLRERLYVEEPEAGDAPGIAAILIYTASADSDGSLGGLVSLATPDQLDVILARTVEDLQWCGSDPVCSELEPELQGDRFSGAACHACLLVPETSCESFNRELDRTLLVGGGLKSEVPGLFEEKPAEG